MLWLNTLLKEAGLDPKEVKLLRHSESKTKVSLWEVWLKERVEFEIYQSIQPPNNFKDVRYLATFIVNKKGETVFGGIYENNGSEPISAETKCPVHPEKVNYKEDHVFELTLIDNLKGLIGKLVVEWGGANLVWIQKAEKQNKPVLELRKEVVTEEFPGFFEFSYLINELEQLSENWKSNLENMNGVYLLVNLDSGKQYVGSAYGEKGLLGRWMDYAKTGHGNNEGMKVSPTKDFQVSILEVVSPSTPKEEIISRENIWKDKLLSKQFGLNEN